MIAAVLCWYAGTGMVSQNRNSSALTGAAVSQYNVVVKWGFEHKPTADNPDAEGAAKLPILATTLQSGFGVLLCVLYIHFRFRSKGLHEMRLTIGLTPVLLSAPLTVLWPQITTCRPLRRWPWLTSPVSC